MHMLTQLILSHRPSDLLEPSASRSLCTKDAKGSRMEVINGAESQLEVVADDVESIRLTRGSAAPCDGVRLLRCNRVVR